VNRNSEITDNVGNRIAIFVDVRNVYKNGKKYYNGKLNYKKFLEWVAGSSSIVYACAYVMSEDNPDSENKFFDMLRLNGYDIRCKKIFYGESDGKKYAKNNWVLGISLDMAKYSEKVDTLVLASSNPEFIETGYFLKSLPVRLEVVSIKESMDENLRNISTEFTPIPEDCFDIEHNDN